MAEASVAQQIEAAINTELSKRGVAGTVVIRSRMAELHGAGPVVAIDLGEWIEQWNLLPPDMRERRVEAAAVRLVDARKGQSSGVRQGVEVPWGKLVVGVGVVAAIAAALLWLRSTNFFGRPGGASTAAASATPILDPTRRDEQVCEAARARLYAGAAMGVDSEGWVVELFLGRSPATGSLLEEPAIKALLAGERLARDAHPVLGAVDHGTAEIVPAPPDDTQLGVSSLVVRFGDAYASVFLEVKGRTHFEELAARVAHDVGADFAALYARCAHLSHHDVGAWYRGADESAAVASMLYASGAFLEPPAIKLERFGTQKGALPSLTEAIRSLEPARVGDALSETGGKLSRQGDATVVRFPVGGPTRAGIASRTLAELLPRD